MTTENKPDLWGPPSLYTGTPTAFVARLYTSRIGLNRVIVKVLLMLRCGCGDLFSARVIIGQMRMSARPTQDGAPVKIHATPGNPTSVTPVNPRR